MILKLCFKILPILLQIDGKFSILIKYLYLISIIRPYFLTVFAIFNDSEVLPGKFWTKTFGRIYFRRFKNLKKIQP